MKLTKIIFAFCLVLAAVSQDSKAQMGGCALFWGPYSGCMDAAEGAYSQCLADSGQIWNACIDHCESEPYDLQSCYAACNGGQNIREAQCSARFSNSSCVCYRDWCDPWRMCGFSWD